MRKKAALQRTDAINCAVHKRKSQSRKLGRHPRSSLPTGSVFDTDLAQTRRHAFPIDSAKHPAASSLSGFSNAGHNRADSKCLDAARIEKPKTRVPFAAMPKPVNYRLNAIICWFQSGAGRWKTAMQIE